MQHDSQLFLGIDVGTGGVRAMAVTRAGQVAAQTSVPFDAGTIQQQGRHEQQPRLWWDAVCRATSTLVDELKTAGFSAEQLHAAAVDGTSGTLLTLDAAGEPLGPAIMYNDTRGADEALRLNARAEQFRHKLGYRFKSSFALAKIAWLEKNEPELFHDTRRFVHQADYIQSRLTGSPGVSDYSNALKTGYDLVDECWPDWIDEMLGTAGRLPRVVAPGTTVGAVSASAARESGLPEGLAVLAGATDGTTACLASGVRQVGDYNTTLGTTLVFKGVSRQICRHPDGLIYCHKLPDGLWLPGAASNTGCEWIDVMFAGADVADMDRAAESRLPIDCISYPLARMGERFPFLCGTAEGFFLREPDDSVGRYAACLQGVALLERLSYEVLDRVAGTSGGEVYSTGGGSRSDVWMQCRSDATGRVVHRPACGESAFGAAGLAAAGTVYNGLGEAVENMVRIDKTFTPNPQHADRYQALAARLREEWQKRGYC